MNPSQIAPYNNDPPPNTSSIPFLWDPKDLIDEGAPLWLANLGINSSSNVDDDDKRNDYKLNGAWLKMCIDLSIWPDVWKPLLDFKKKKSECLITSIDEFEKLVDDIPEECNVDTVSTLRTYNIHYIKNQQPHPAAITRMTNLVVRIVSLWPSSDVNDMAIVEDPTGQIAAVVLKDSNAKIGSEALSPGTVLLLEKISVVVLGSCQTLVISPRTISSIWSSDLVDPRRSYFASASKKNLQVKE